MPANVALPDVEIIRAAIEETLLVSEERGFPMLTTTTTDGMKRCCRHRDFLPRSEFNVNPIHEKTSRALHPYCKDCQRAFPMWKERSPEERPYRKEDRDGKIPPK